VGRYAIILVKFNNFITYGRGRDGNGLLLHELLEIIEEDDRTPQSVAICPPDEPPGADTDRDSDLSDEEGDTVGKLHHSFWVCLWTFGPSVFIRPMG
jgi:hypothetical protein